MDSVCNNILCFLEKCTDKFEHLMELLIVAVVPSDIIENQNKQKDDHEQKDNDEDITISFV